MISRRPRRSIVFDARCLQDPDYARRGVGRHAIAILRGAPRDSNTRLVGLLDRRLPPLSDEAQDLFDDTKTNAYATEFGCDGSDELAAFVGLSPMTHDPILNARLLSHPGVMRIAAVYDFIPMREPGRYMPSAAERLRYSNQLRWLARYDRFAPISEATADDLIRVLAVSAQRVTVTGAPLDARFIRLKPVSRSAKNPGHILVVGGGDPRKNPEVVIRAHAKSLSLQRRGITLVVAGNYGHESANSFFALARECGGEPALLTVPGHVPDSVLIDFYLGAHVIVSPSRDEGFSLPVIEGMASSAMVLASDIPAHAELVRDADRRFLPNDENRLTLLLERAWADVGWHERSLLDQNRVWPMFKAENVARLFWEPLVGAVTKFQTIHVRRGCRPRVALLSPLPPDRSGVADYTAATCVELAKLVDLHVFTDTAEPLAIKGVASVKPLHASACIDRTFDRVIGVLGNSHFHRRIYELLQEHGGAAIAHDARMLSFYWTVLGPQRAVSEASRELGRSITTEELIGWLQDERTLKALFLGEICEAASPVIVHSPVSARLIKQKYKIEPRFIPFSIYRPWSSSDLTSFMRVQARKRLGFPDHQIILATFGYVHSSKAPEECIWAVELLRRWNLPVSLHFVGGVENLPDHGQSLLELAERLGIREHVSVVGEYVSEQTYTDYLVGSDLAIQLRTYGLGGLSGALLDCAAAGVPTVTNESLASAVGVPESYVRNVPDILSPVLIAEALSELIESGVHHTRNETEREIFSRERSLRVYSERLCRELQLDLAQ